MLRMDWAIVDNGNSARTKMSLAVDFWLLDI